MARAVELGVRVVDRHGRRSVVEVGMLILDERYAPFTVLVYRQLPLLEGVRGGELVAETGLEPDELVVPVPIDEVLLPGQLPRPGGVLREDRLAVGVGVLAAEQRTKAQDLVRGAVVEARGGIETDDLQRTIGVALCELFRVRGQLRHRPRRARNARLLEQVLVVVEAEGVGE
jgi:hypothetical protein